MAIWKLIAHHDEPVAAADEMISRNRIAIGWGDIGDMRKFRPSNADDISTLIAKAYDGISNAHLGGRSLWYLYRQVKIGDMVILSVRGRRRCVLEVVGPYLYESGNRQIRGYVHQRPVTQTAIDPDRLWRSLGSKISDGQNVHLTLAACSETAAAEREVFKEGRRYSVTSTAYERDDRARRKCIEHFGCKCFICGFEFENVYGDLGRGYIHVHHKVPLAMRGAEYEVDPLKDLVPLCPNCHAMAHQDGGVSIEELESAYLKHK